jgi:uncharacterized membrane protein
VDWAAWALAGVGLGVYLVLTLAQWHRQVSPSLDLAIFEQAVKGYASFGPPVVDLKGPGVIQLGDHFSPVLVLLAPFYLLFPSPVTLLVAQCFLVALSVVPVATVARRRLGGWLGICVGVAYALSWGLQTGVDAQFHEYAFAVPMLAFALAAALDQRWRAAALWAAATLTVKEDMGLTVLAFGAVMAVHGWWRQRQGRAGGGAPGWVARRTPGQGAPALGQEAPGPETPRTWRSEFRIGMALTAAGALAMILILGVVIPAFRHGDWFYWEKLGGNGGALGLIVGVLSPPIKLRTLLLVTAVVGGACWFSRWSLVALPTLAWRFASTDPAHWGTTWHYSMILMPVIFLAAVDAWGRWKRSKRVWVRAVPPLMVAVITAFAVVALWWFPLGGLFNPATYRAPTRAAQVSEVLEAIPPGSTVATDRGLVTRLATDYTVYWLGDYASEVQPDYVLIDPASGWRVDPGPVEAYAESVYGGRYEPVGGIGPPNDPWAYRLARRLPG